MIAIAPVSSHAQLQRIRCFGLRTPEFATDGATVFWKQDTLNNWLDSNGGPLLVATANEEDIAGYLLASSNVNGLVTIENLQVLTEFQGQGIGHRLIDAFESQARIGKALSARTLFSCENKAIAALFQKHGYLAERETLWFSNSNLVRNNREPPSESAFGDVRILTRSHAEALTALVIESRQYPWGTQGKFQVLDWITDSSGVFLGGFENEKLVAAGLASFHEPTRKSTLELLVARDINIRSSLLSRIVESILVYADVRAVDFVTAHPRPSDRAVLECLSQAGFSRGRSFIPYAKVLRGQDVP